MNLNLLSFAETYYHTRGFQKIEVPWTVDKAVSNLTKPPQRHNYFLEGKVLVGSAEQSFLQEYFSGRLTPGRYLASTPCFRDEEILDDLHRQYFLKTELIQIGKVNKKSLRQIINIAKDFFVQFIPVKEIALANGSYDIYSENTDIELGSYGIREFTLNNKSIKYIYATGCALPRLSQVISLEKKTGYHKNLDIPKTKIGSILKIFEEVYELQDAVFEKQKLLVLCELADILGAIDWYLVNNEIDLTLDDLYQMSQLTKRAFKTGAR
ncbi:MAG TPA: hypothetical protein PLI45_02265 [Candidatus Woesebacteria bacterium]|nr:hypothetical protein [Candidatus Woesebacteria bacterium]